MARGARRPNSHFAGKLDLFFAAEIGYTRSRRSDLHNLREVAILDYRRALRENYLTLATVSYFVHLIELVAERETPIPELYELLASAISFLEVSDPSRKLVERFELRVAEFLGISRSDRPAHELVREMFHGLPGSREKLFSQFKGRCP